MATFPNRHCSSLVVAVQCTMDESSGKDTLEAVSGEGQSSVCAGLALGAASADSCLYVLLPHWPHTEERDTDQY